MAWLLASHRPEGDAIMGSSIPSGKSFVTASQASVEGNRWHNTKHFYSNAVAYPADNYHQLNHNNKDDDAAAAASIASWHGTEGHSVLAA
jgi:hypothetical protein